ncbi:MAG TPA: glycosyltransferase, partial [Dongiaceae bacterium]|nr:glycosyltransferase [Dongiaceae bacterium]
RSCLRPAGADETWGSTWGTIFSLQPVIVASWPSIGFPLGIASPLGSWLHDMRIEFLMMPAWAWELPEIYGEILTHAAEHRRRHPRHRFSFLCNTPAQEPPFAAAGWPVTTMNANMFLDESTFRPLPKAELAFTAIYNARLSKDKRIDLAAGIERACFIYFYTDELTVSEFHAEHARLSALMPTATFLNRLTPGGCEYLWGKDINVALNRSRVGLCLSAVEGQMRASMEYMLAGLPIVSTPSIGGRDYFFDPDYCVIAPADPRSIAEAVAALIARNIPRDYIRQKTWARVERERARFTAFVQNRIGRRGGDDKFAARFEELVRSWQVKPWLTNVRGFAEQLDSAVLEAKRRR